TDDARWRSYLEHGPAAVDFLRQATRLRFMWSRGYADYHADRPGGSAAGRTCESKPFDASVLGEHRGELRAGSMAAPVPMPIAGVAYRRIDPMATGPGRGLPRGARRAAQGRGGEALGPEDVGGGPGPPAGLYEAVLPQGIPVWRNAALRAVTTDRGRVDGAVVEHGGHEVRVRARRGVVLAAGGFDHDLEQRRARQLDGLDGWSMGSPGNTGDAIAAASGIGAGSSLLEQAWWFPAVAPLPGDA